MTIKELKNLVIGKVTLSTRLSYLIFGGQGSLYISKLEYCPSKKQLKLMDETKETFKDPALYKDLLIFPEDTEILIEGYPGDENTPLQWETPDNIDICDNCLDFQRLLSDEEHQIISDAEKELQGIVNTLKDQDIPEYHIKEMFEKITKKIEE